MTSLLLLEIIYMLANLLISENTLPFKWFSLYIYFEGNYVIVSIKICPDFQNVEQ